MAGSVYEITLQKALEKGLLQEWHISDNGVLYVTDDEGKVLRIGEGINAKREFQSFVLGLSVGMG